MDKIQKMGLDFLQPKDAWDGLSLADKAKMMEVAVRNGITNLQEIRKKYNEFAEGGNLFTGGGYVYDVLPKLMKEAGLDVRVTSGYREPGKVGKVGSKSWHGRHGAVDIVPQGKTTFEDIENAIYNNPVISSYMLSNGFGLIDESGRSKESRDTMKRTGATGAHFHIGKDSTYAKRYADRMAELARASEIAPAVSTAVYNPYILQQQTALPYPEVVSTPTTLPTLPSEVELGYHRKQQEAAENRYRFNMAMNVLNLLNGDKDPAESFLQNFMPSPSIPLFEGLPEDQYAKGGKIYIKPSHRGRLTELKKRTGKTEAELYRTGSPAVRKMITFARSARKWKHSDGGYLNGPVIEAALAHQYGPGGTLTLGPRYYMYDENGQIMRYPDGTPMIQVNASTFPEVTIIPDNQKSPADRNEDERFRARTQKDYDEHKQSEWTARQANSWRRSYNQSGAKKVEDFFKTEQKDEWKKPTYFSAFDSSLKPYGEFLGALAHGLQPLSPSQHVGAAADAIQGKRGYFDSLFNGNSGFFSDQWAAEHPLVSLYGNMVGDATAGIGAFKGYNAGKQFVQNNHTGAFGKPVVPEGYSAASPTIRTKVGDVEINNPSLFYRQGPTDMGDDFLQTGIVGAGTEFDNPMFARGKLWYGLGDAAKKPVAEAPKREGRFLLSKPRMDKPKPDLIVSNADMVPADSHSHPRAEIVTKQRTHPYGEKDYATFPQFKDIMDEWNNAYYAGDIPDKVPVTQVNSEYVRVVPREEGSATTANSTLYRYDPNYGYRKVSGFSEDTPAAEWATGKTENFSFLDGKPEIGMYVTLDKKSYNYPAIISDLKRGVSDAVKFLGSAVKTDADAHNIELAKRLGYSRFTPYDEAAQRASVQISPKYYVDSKGLAGYVKKNPDDPNLDKLGINVLYDTDKGGFHETLHRGNYGEFGKKEFDPKTMDFMERHRVREDTEAMYKYKTESLMTPRTEENAEWHDYMSQRGEAAVNSLEIGRRMGVTPGAPWPGREKAMELFKKFAESSDPKTNAFNVLNWKQKPRRVWDAITGRYFTLGVGTAEVYLTNDD